MPLDKQCPSTRFSHWECSLWSHSMCDQDVDWCEHHDQNQNVYFVYIPWIGLGFLSGQSYFCRLLGCHTNYNIKCRPLLVVHPCLYAQLLASILRLHICNQIPNATVPNRTLWLCALDVPFTSSPTIILYLSCRLSYRLKENFLRGSA